MEKTMEKVDVHILNYMSGRRIKRPESKVDVHILNCMSGKIMTRSKSKVLDKTLLKRLKITFIKPEDTLLIKDLTINCHTTHANKEFQMSEPKILEVNEEDDLEIKENNLQQLQMHKGHHTPPHLVYNILSETPELDTSYKQPSGLPYW